VATHGNNCTYLDVMVSFIFGFLDLETIQERGEICRRLQKTNRYFSGTQQENKESLLYIKPMKLVLMFF
jgi:hypothetical protein